MNNINWVSFGLCEISRSDAVEIFTWAFSDGAFHRYVLDTWKASPNNLEYVARNRSSLAVIWFATTSGWPLYLEATSPRSRDLFKRVGFKIVREIKVGVGQVDGEGVPSDGGEGVSLWVATFDV
ncbi:unnamed protein product [Cercospora beticola]|nr:unnamed protein product [Cercospora beticola]